MDDVCFIIHSKHFAVSEGLQSPGKFFISNLRLPYLEDFVSNISSIRRYISGIRKEVNRWYILGNEAAEQNEVQGYPKTK